MKKTLIIVLLLAIISLSGCTLSFNMVSLDELKTHPNKYVGKTVTVEGTVVERGNPVVLNQGDNNIRFYPPEKCIDIYVGGTYVVTGIYDNPNMGRLWLRNVTKVEIG